MSEYNWQVGMEVSEWLGGWGPPCPTRIMRIAKLGRLKLTTDDGRAWSANHGYRWGELYVGSHIRPTEPGDHGAMVSYAFRRRALARIDSIRWRDLTDDQLRAVLAALPEESSNIKV